MRRNQPSLNRNALRRGWCRWRIGAACLRTLIISVVLGQSVLFLRYRVPIFNDGILTKEAIESGGGSNEKDQEPTMPPQDSSLHTAGFIHVGKTGGSTLSTLLRNGCTSFVQGPCRNITHETVVSKYVEHYYHVPDFWRLPKTKHEAFVISVRDPFDRSVSSLLYHHPQNAKVYQLQQTKKQLYYGPLVYACFPTLEDFAQLMQGSSTNCNYPYRQNSIVADDCAGLACAVLHGKVRLFSHLFFNYRNILYTKLPTEPKRKIYVLRQEYMWQDWKQLNKLLGQTKEVVVPKDSSNLRNISGIALPITRNISTDGKQKLCLALKSEFEAYFQLLLLAINIDDSGFKKSLSIADTNCPNLNVPTMVQEIRQSKPSK